MVCFLKKKKKKAQLLPLCISIPLQKKNPHLLESCQSLLNYSAMIIKGILHIIYTSPKAERPQVSLLAVSVTI